jgi:hypothetical protein
MRNRIEIGDPCGEGCPNDPDYPLKASSYTETFSAYDPYPNDMPPTPDPIVYGAVQRVWDLPAGSPNPVHNADYILAKYYYEAYQGQISASPVLYYHWSPRQGGDEQGIYFFTEWPVVQ